MDWALVIKRNGEALKRVLAGLIVMAAIAEGASTLPRRLHRAILRLLRPAEAAVRRLVVVVAREMPTPVLPLSRQPQFAPVALPLGARLVTLSHLGLAGCTAAPPPRAQSRRLSLPLIDPLPLPRSRSYVPVLTVPRVFTQETVRLAPVPPPPSPHDLIDATRLGLRLRALGRALEDLPAQARRLVRWKARRDRARGRMRRLSPLRPGRAPGSLRRSTHEVHEVLKDLHIFARLALEQPDTS
jgi:hypothetical protein